MTTNVIFYHLYPLAQFSKCSIECFSFLKPFYFTELKHNNNKCRFTSEKARQKISRSQMHIVIKPHEDIGSKRSYVNLALVHFQYLLIRVLIQSMKPLIMYHHGMHYHFNTLKKLVSKRS